MVRAAVLFFYRTLTRTLKQAIMWPFWSKAVCEEEEAVVEVEETVEATEEAAEEVRAKEP